MLTVSSALRMSGIAIACNVALSVIKIVVGCLGHSYALLADGMESSIDVLSSIVVWAALKTSQRPPDKKHPFGHGKAESLAGFSVAIVLFGAAGMIAYHAVLAILHPGGSPSWFTLPILAMVIVLKEFLFRKVLAYGEELKSTALQSDAWHHRADAITSIAAFIGISVSLIGGKGYERADSWAALVACAAIIYNAYRLVVPAMDEVMDAAVEAEFDDEVRKMAGTVSGVEAIEKCRIRKSGLGYYMDIHVQVNSQITVAQGHEIGHRVKDRLLESNLSVKDVVVHIEPFPPPAHGS